MVTIKGYHGKEPTVKKGVPSVAGVLCLPLFIYVLFKRELVLS